MPAARSQFHSMVVVRMLINYIDSARSSETFATSKPAKLADGSKCNFMAETANAET